MAQQTGSHMLCTMWMCTQCILFHFASGLQFDKSVPLCLQFIRVDSQLTWVISTNDEQYQSCIHFATTMYDSCQWRLNHDTMYWTITQMLCFSYRHQMHVMYLMMLHHSFCLTKSFVSRVNLCWAKSLKRTFGINWSSFLQTRRPSSWTSDNSVKALKEL